MEKMADIMLKRKEPFRSRAYQKAQNTIINFPEKIIDPIQLKGLPNIGATIMENLQEYIKTGTLKIIEAEKQNPVNIFIEVYGIGPKKAKELVDKGIYSIEQLKENQQLLNDVQRIGLKYYKDILQRIPRAEIEEYKAIFETYFQNKKNAQFEIVGSYRRGAETSGDIDVIITSNNEEVYTNFVDYLKSKNIIKEILSRGSTKCLVITKLPSSEFYRRVDFLYTSVEEFPFAILYFTGSKQFNTVMRQRALDMGYTMNEHGLYKLSREKKIEDSFYTEKDIFNYLKLVYKEPNQRIDGNAVIIKPSKAVVENSDNILSILQNFKQKGITVLSTLNEEYLKKIIEVANEKYYNDIPILSDNEFDILKDYISSKCVLENIIGSPVERNKVILPYSMASMDKIKPDTNALKIWTTKYKGPYVISCKLDGVSGLYTTEGNTPQLYTRGDGKIGQNISHLIPYLQLPKIKNITIRGEFILLKEVFATKYSSKFSNARNMVAGIINNKTVHKYIEDVHFVAYEVICPELIPFKQLEYLSTIDIQTVFYKIEKDISNEKLSDTLVEWREKSIYEIDGLIITNNALYERTDQNPLHSFAFKMILSEQIAEAHVVDVLWTPSKDGYLKPRVQIMPISLAGVCIEYATGFNAAFINENKIGVGSVIEIIRSGDVIPHIRKVIIPAENPKMPEVFYKWNDTKIDIILENLETDETVREKNITGFFKGIGVDFLSSGNIIRIMQSGFKTVPVILKMQIDDFLKVEGFKIKMATKLFEGIKERIEKASLITIMSASNIFGRGFSETKLTSIMTSEQNILLSNISSNEKIKKLLEIKGIAVKTAEAFVEKIPVFIEFLKESNLYHKLIISNELKEKDKTHPLYGKNIVLTGFRDSKLQELLIFLGAKINANVSKNTSFVLVKNITEDTSKTYEAKKLNIPLITLENFREKYNV
jgi:NAD-dependent DNA ligase